MGGSPLSLVSTLTCPVSQLWSPRGVVCAGGEYAVPLTQPCTHHQLIAASVRHAQAGGHCLHTDSVLGGYDWLGLSLCLFYTCIFLELQDTKHGLGGVRRGTSYSWGSSPRDSQATPEPEMESWFIELSGNGGQPFKKRSSKERSPARQRDNSLRGPSAQREAAHTELHLQYLQSGLGARARASGAEREPTSLAGVTGVSLLGLPW